MEPASAQPQSRTDRLGVFKSIVDFFTGVTGLVTAALGILGTVVAFALASGGDDSQSPDASGGTAIAPATTAASIGSPASSHSRDVTSELSDVCNTLAAETESHDAAFALPRAAATLRTIAAASADPGAIGTSADELDQAAVLFDQQQDATPAVISAVDRLAALGASSCQR